MATITSPRKKKNRLRWQVSEKSASVLLWLRLPAETLCCELRVCTYSIGYPNDPLIGAHGALFCSLSFFLLTLCSLHSLFYFTRSLTFAHSLHFIRPHHVCRALLDGVLAILARRRAALAEEEALAEQKANEARAADTVSRAWDALGGTGARADNKATRPAPARINVMQQQEV